MQKLGVSIILIIIMIFSGAAIANQPLETKSARLIEPGRIDVESAFEFQTSSDGKEYAAPIAIGCGLADRFEFLVEPVFYTAIRPKIGPRATGVGDLEATLEYLTFNEQKNVPAIALAAELKVPATKNNLIGTGKTDFTGYLIAIKRFGKLDVHGNLGYAILGKPAGISLQNIIVFAMAGQYHLSPRFNPVGEFLGNTSSEVTGSSFTGSENANAPEIAGGELVGMIGGRYKFNQNTIFSLGLCYDNNQAVLVRPGVTLAF